jgi:hypothetical protein
MDTDGLHGTQPGIRDGNRCGAQNSRSVWPSVRQLRESEMPVHDT